MIKGIVFIAVIILSILMVSSNTDAVQEQHNVTLVLKFNNVSLIIGNNYILTLSAQNTSSGIVIKDNANNFQQTSTTISSNYNVGTKAYITYTTGNIEDIKQRIILIRGNTYNTLYNPSFAFPIAKKNTLEVGIEYDTINIGNDDVLKLGFNNLVIKNIGFINNKNSLSITKE